MYDEFNPCDADLVAMEKQELLFNIARLRQEIEELIFRAKVYGDVVTTDTLSRLNDELKELIKRFT